MSTAVDFLKQLRPDGPWVLTAIVPDGAITTKTLTTTDAVDRFLAQHDNKRNIYYALNPTKGALTKKASKTDIAAAEYTHADLDPCEDETPDAAKQRYQTQLANFEPSPTVVVDSGNGIQALWRLDPPLGPEHFEQIEACSLALTLALGGTAGTQNVDRILRLPGTTNLPNKKKLNAGRVSCPTRLLHFNRAAYPLDRFDIEADDIEAATLPDDIDAPPVSPRDTDEFENIAPDDPRLAGLSAKWIELGRDGTGIAENYNGDRSRAVMAFATECFRVGIDETIIASLLMRWRIGEHIRDQSNVARALNRTIDKARQFVENSKLFEMNEKHAVLPIGGKTRVATWGEDPEFPGHQTIVRFATFFDFRSLQDRYRHIIQVEGEAEEVPLGSWWIGHPHRRQYDNGMRFMPQSDEDVVNGMLNLWQGFAVAARKPDGGSGASGCRRFLAHGLKIICSGNEEHYDYLIKREAFIAQKRTRSEIALGLQTEVEGTGKGFWCRNINRLYGNHAMEVQNPTHVIGKHNIHLERLLRLTADEALFAPDPNHRNALYNLITEPRITIEPKFVDAYSARNHNNIDVISNASHFVPVSGTARRFFIPTVSSGRANEHAYFDKINTELHDGGYEALLYHLLHEIDLRDFNVRAVPKTAALAEQAAYSRRGVDLLIEMVCHDAVVPCQFGDRVGVSICRDVDNSYGGPPRRGFDWYIDHHTDRDLSRLGSLKVKRRLKDDWGCITGKEARASVHGDQMNCVNWPSLAELRAKFEAKYGTQVWTRSDVTVWLGADPRSTDDDDIPF